MLEITIRVERAGTFCVDGFIAEYQKSSMVSPTKRICWDNYTNSRGVELPGIITQRLLGTSVAL